MERVATSKRAHRPQVVQRHNHRHQRLPKLLWSPAGPQDSCVDTETTPTALLCTVCAAVEAALVAVVVVVVSLWAPIQGSSSLLAVAWRSAIALCRSTAPIPPVTTTLVLASVWVRVRLRLRLRALSLSLVAASVVAVAVALLLVAAVATTSGEYWSFARVTALAF
jgi:hypothetical protein